MKQLLISASILLCFAIVSCSKASGPVNGPSVQPNNNQDSTVSVSATINGKKWQTDSAVGYIVKPSGNDSAVQGILITTYPDSGSPNFIVFNLTTYTGPGIYKIAPPINEVLYYVGTARHPALSGQVTITSDTAYALKGTFNFVADTFTVTNGIFNVAMP